MYDLTDLKTIKRILSKYGFGFSKSLGQNFLINPEIPESIANGAEISPEDCVIEIGPGIGCLSASLAKRAKKVLCIEIDETLRPVLADTLSDFSNVYVHFGDVLKCDLKALIREHFPENANLKVCANLPYYITTPVIMYLLESDIPFDSVTVMVQKEVAQRLCADEKKREYGAISLSVDYYSKASLLFDVPSHNFYPAPSVCSSVVNLKVRKQPAVTDVPSEKLFKLIKAAFSQRRKTLANSISGILPDMSKNEIKEVITSCGFSPDIRGEKLSVYDYAELVKKLKI